MCGEWHVLFRSMLWFLCGLSIKNWWPLGKTQMAWNRFRGQIGWFCVFRVTFNYYSEDRCRNRHCCGCILVHLCGSVVWCWLLFEKCSCRVTALMVPDDLVLVWSGMFGFTSYFCCLSYNWELYTGSLVAALTASWFTQILMSPLGFFSAFLSLGTSSSSINK